MAERSGRPAGAGTGNGTEPKAAEAVAARLRRSIALGELVDGQQLPGEIDLMAAQGVSRPVLREAMRVLESESLITVQRGAKGGVFVTVPGPEAATQYVAMLLQSRQVQVRELCRAAAAIEAEYVYELVAGATSGEVLDRIGSLGLTGEDVDFHRLMRTSSGNRVASTLLEMLSAIIERHGALRGAWHRRCRDHQTHTRVLELSLAGSRTDAARLWRQHVLDHLEGSNDRSVLDVLGPVGMMGSWNPAEGGRRSGSLPKGADIVAAELRRRIIGGVLVAGDSVPTESALMADFGFSRPTVREAIRILESERLVQQVRGSHQGGRVTAPSMAVAARHVGLLFQLDRVTLEDVFAVRKVLEVAAVGLLAERHAKRSVGSLRKAQQRDAADVASSDGAIDWSMGLRFHREVVEACASPALEVLWGLIERIVERTVAAVRAQGAAQSRQSWTADVEDVHASVLEPIEAGDVARAQRLWRAHTQEGLELLAPRVRPTMRIDVFS